MWALECYRCHVMVEMPPGLNKREILRQHMIKKHGYPVDVSGHHLSKLLKNYFTGEPIYIVQ